VPTVAVAVGIGIGIGIGIAVAIATGVGQNPGDDPTDDDQCQADDPGGVVFADTFGDEESAPCNEPKRYGGCAATTASGNGQITYGAPGIGGRSTTAEACLTSTYLEENDGSPTNDASRNATVGYRIAQNIATQAGATPTRFTINACHLIGDQLGGDGTNTQNLAACSRQANAWPQAGFNGMKYNMLYYESKVKKAVDAGEVVLYKVTPEYINGNIIPTAFRMSAACTADCEGSILPLDVTVQNVLVSRNSTWVNLGWYNSAPSA
jgi:hypothetical protein